MPIELKMPALSPTMEKGTLAKWLVAEGDLVASGDQLAEIETDKATMEMEAVEEGRITQILVQEGTENVPVGTVIALLTDGAAPSAQAKAASAAAVVGTARPAPMPATLANETPPPKNLSGPGEAAATPSSAPPDKLSALNDGKISISPLAARIAKAKNIDLGPITGTGPAGRIMRGDLGIAPAASVIPSQGVALVPEVPEVPTAASLDAPIPDVPHAMVKLSGMRKIIAARLTQSKQQIPHIYLSVDVRLDALLALRSDINSGLATRGIKVSVNDMTIKALALSLIEVPACNVQFAGDRMAQFTRADISVAVSIPNGLITPIITGADMRSVADIASDMKHLASRARDGKLQPQEYQGGTASLSNLGMFGIKQFQAVINPPQGMIMAIGSGEWRPMATASGTENQQMLSATGSFDHRAIDGADAARLMQAFRQFIEEPLALFA